MARQAFRKSLIRIMLGRGIEQQGSYPGLMSVRGFDPQDILCAAQAWTVLVGWDPPHLAVPATFSRSRGEARKRRPRNGQGRVLV